MNSDLKRAPTESRPSSSGTATDLGDLASDFMQRLAKDQVLTPEQATPRDSFEAFAKAVRDQLADRWLLTRQTYDTENPKQAYYLSMEFLIGRSLANNVMNLQLGAEVEEAARQLHLDWIDLVEQEPDAGLGNGGLGRLAACYIESMATLALPGMGYGLRYDYGIFQQSMEQGWQKEHPDNWLLRTDPWEVPRPDRIVNIPLNCSFEVVGGELKAIPHRPSNLVAIPYDRPVVGYGGKTVNTLRLWSAASSHYFAFDTFSHGDFVGAIAETLAAESLTRVLYPDDSTNQGKGLRFVQEYFLVAASLADLLRRFCRRNDNWDDLPDKIAIQLNDTHPSMAVPELMRLLLDDQGMDWDRAWDLTTRSIAYTNHTLLPEALEKWPVHWFEVLLPRHLEIINEINRRLLIDAQEKFPDDKAKHDQISVREETEQPSVRMANLAIVGSHSTNGVAEIHSRLLRSMTVRDLHDMFPDRFNNKTNGITPRRWLRLCNPALSNAITDAIGDSWVTDLTQLAKLKPLADDAAFQDQFHQANRQSKQHFAAWIQQTYGLTVDPDSIFDSQVKRIHEYKRQLLNALRIVVLYQRILANPQQEFVPRTFFFAGKAAPSYTYAKLIIKLINNLADVINNDPVVAGRIRVCFLPEYNVSLAERLIPASDISNQISTAGYEASGTSNMKFMLNGALTVGTRDGATIEMAEEAGEENFFLFGLTADQVADSRNWYNPSYHYENEPETRAALDAISSDQFSPNEPGIFTPIVDKLLRQQDQYMHLADLASYIQTQDQVDATYSDRPQWCRKSILNVAGAGKFSSDRAISQYAKEIWNLAPCIVPNK